MKTVSLSRQAAPAIPSMGSGAVRSHGPQAKDQRSLLRDYLVDKIGVPGNLIEQRLDGMTLAERVYTEIEMMGESRQNHSFDYDPMAYGRG